MKVVPEVRKKLDVIHKQLFETQEGVSTMADDRAAAVEICDQTLKYLADYQQLGAHAEDLAMPG